MSLCIDCDVPVSGLRSRCSECTAEVDETPDWRRPRPGASRTAHCGHEVASHPGRKRRTCDVCTEVRPSVVICHGCDQDVSVGARGPISEYCPRRCRTWANSHPGVPTPALGVCPPCGAQLDRTGKKYCSRRCSDIARGERLAEPLPRRPCALPECGKEFQPRRGSQRCCCERHGKTLCNREGRATGRHAPDPWSDRRRDNYHRRRARKVASSTGRPVVLAEIAERDRWKCGICRRSVNPKLPWPHPKSPSLDHIEPISRGGAHDPANVRLAHLGCNSARGNRGGGEQLLLVG